MEPKPHTMYSCVIMDIIINPCSFRLNANGDECLRRHDRQLEGGVTAWRSLGLRGSQPPSARDIRGRTGKERKTRVRSFSECR